MASLLLEKAYQKDDLRLLRQIRLLLLLDGAADAGLEPVPLTVLHALAYLSNVLAPVWHLQPFDGKILKRRDSPFYPVLQEELDRLVGRGLIKVSEIRYVKDEGKWRIDATYTLHGEFSTPVINAIRDIGFEPVLKIFCAELAQAMAALPPDLIATVMGEDATYGDPTVDVSNVVNFAEGQAVNYAANSAKAFRPDIPLTPSERVHLYVQHLQDRAQRHAG